LSWLQQVYGEDPIPQFEINSFTLSVLEQLARRNIEQNKHAEIITKDYIQKTVEYSAEGKFNFAVFMYVVDICCS